MNGHELRRTLDAHEQIAKIYADPRFPKSFKHPDLRTYAVALIWVSRIECAPADQMWDRILEVLNVDMRRIWELIGEDAPRYEPPREALYPQPQTCEAPMIRRPGRCGKYGSTRTRVTDPSDGTWRMAAFCTRHDDHWRKVVIAEKAMRQAGGIPEPTPNTGGLLPCHFGGDWIANYKAARTDWEPPSLGIRADDWPVMAKVTAMEPPSLSVLEGGGEQAAGGELFATPPSLRLV